LSDTLNRKRNRETGPAIINRLLLAPLSPRQSARGRIRVTFFRVEAFDCTLWLTVDVQRFRTFDRFEERRTSRAIK
jgi:hypothetical protein